MRKYILLSLVLLSACSIVRSRPSGNSVAVRDVPFAARGDEEGDSVSLKRRLLILPILNKSEASAPGIAEDARESLIASVSAMNAAVLVHPSDMPTPLSEFQENEGYKIPELLKAASKAGVAAVSEGQILSVKIRRSADSVGLFRQVKSVIEAKVQLKIYATRNGKVLMDKIFTKTAEDANYRVVERADQDRYYQENPELIQQVINDAFRQISPETMTALSKLAWEGKVALVQGDKVYLNVGRLSGVQLGDILKVTEEGEEVFDPETGGSIGKIPGRMKGTLEVVSYFGQDGAVAITHSGAGFKENDKIELY